MKGFNEKEKECVFKVRVNRCEKSTPQCNKTIMIIIIITNAKKKKKIGSHQNVQYLSDNRL